MPALVLAEVDEACDAGDGVGVEAVADEVCGRAVEFDIGFDEAVEELIGGERVLVCLVVAELGAGRLFDGVDGDDDSVAVDVSGELPDAPFCEVCDGRECAAHVAIECAVADGEFRLVACGEQEGVVVVGVCHEEDASDAGLEVLFGEAVGLVLEGGLQGFPEYAEGGLDGDGVG